MTKRAEIDPHAGETLDKLASRFGVSKPTVKRFSREHRMPPRRTADPTPEEIEILKAELRANHLAELLAESDSASINRSWRHRGQIA